MPHGGQSRATDPGEAGPPKVFQHSVNPVPAVQTPQGSTSGTLERTAEALACPEPRPSLQSDPQVSPEACAETLLKSESPDMSSILAMCENLPWEKPHVDACSQGRAFYAGGYRKSGIFGLRKHCKDSPLSSGF